ncbi:MAG: hypothetical protein Q8M08_15935 [Bacteroidales bacterium]|nr:hypothetical protein [Bacteroidales bacterium]
MNNQKLLFVFFAGLLLSASINCIGQSWQWAISCGKGINDDYATIASDNSGNIYMTGSYNGLGIFGNDTLISSGLGGPYLPVMFCKINPTGSFQWVKSIIGEQPSGAFASVAINKNFNNIYFYGQYSGDVTIGGYNLQSNTVQIFLTRYDPDGNCEWAIQAGGNGADYADKACVDNMGNIFIAGIVYDTASFDSIIVGPGNYLAKYNEHGKCQWARRIGNGSFSTRGITTNGSQVILVGKATVNFPFYFDSFLLDPSESPLVVASFDTNGTGQWAKIEGKGLINGIINTVIDSNNNFYISGYGGNLIFGNDTVINNSSSLQLFLVKLNNLGNPIWARESSGYNNVNPTQLTLGINNNIYITGYISFVGLVNATTYFGNYFVTIADLPMKVDMLIVGYDDNGNCIGVNQAPTDYAQMQPSGGTSVAADLNGNCIVAGQFINSTNFGSDTLTSLGKRDIFVAKYGPFYDAGIDERTTNNQLVIYANPNDGKCSILLPKEFMHEQNLTLSIYNSRENSFGKSH